MIIGKLRPSLYLCLMAIVWSGVSAATCGVSDHRGLFAVRFFLGVVEAPLFPGEPAGCMMRQGEYRTTADASGAIYVMSCWYTRREMAFRCALLYTGQTLAFCVAGLIAAGKYYSECLNINANPQLYLVPSKVETV